MVDKTVSNIIDETKSVCPFCLKVLPALIYQKEGQVYMYKTCSEHGNFDVYLWPDAERYQWFSNLAFSGKSRQSQTETIHGCPLDCGICPEHRRGITLPEIEVTWQCNLSCPVCYLAAERKYPDPSLSVIEGMLKTIRRYDIKITSLQITGGEPTIRPDLPEIIALAKQNGFTDIELNTNGLVIADNPNLIGALKKAGLTNIYLQFDGIKSEVTQKLRGADILNLKLKTIDNCRTEGVPIILAVTVVEGINDDQLGEIIDFAVENLDIIAGISLQPAFWSGRFEVEKRRHLSPGDIAGKIAAQSHGSIESADFWPVGCVHPLCDISTYLILDNENGYIPLTRGLTEKDIIKYQDPAGPQGSAIIDIITGKQNHTSVPSGLPILIMGLMDAWTIDLKRLQECNLGVTTADGRTIPFCVYHLTDVSGRRLYPLIKEEVTDFGHSSS